jgi:hypothetical protein
MELSRAIARALIALSLIVGLTATAPARAISYVGKWDPAFGAAFPDLGWRGEAKFFLPNDCLAESGLILNSDGCSDFGMKILSAEVEFYKLSDPTNPAFQETLSFDIPSDVVFSMELDEGLLSGVYGAFLYSRSSTLTLAGAPYTDFTLFFEGDLARMYYVSSPPDGPKTDGYSSRDSIDGRPFMTFSVIPEPGSVPLFLTALLVIGVLARRATARSSQ